MKEGNFMSELGVVLKVYMGNKGHWSQSKEGRNPPFRFLIQVPRLLDVLK